MKFIKLSPGSLDSLKSFSNSNLFEGACFEAAIFRKMGKQMPES